MSPAHGLRRVSTSKRPALRPSALGGPWRCLALAVTLAALWPLARGRAATDLAPGFQDLVVVSGLSSPTAMQFAPDGRLFVAQQGGQLRVIKNGALLATPFLSLSVESSGERGLLGVAFDPAFATNRFVYVFYTATTPSVHNRISRFTANGDVRDTTVAEVVLLDFDNLSGATNHNGGALHFGTDGKLYAAHGDNATGSHAQSMSNLLGKIIRMNPVADPTGQIPTDNPFVATATGKNRLIWARGLRNPFTFSIQNGTGVTFVNDVGQNLWEEVNRAQAGRNFGWPTTEGPFNGASFPEFTNPTYAYRHDTGTPTGCAITGGAFYNPASATFPAAYVGKYFFSDYCGGWIFYIDPASPTSPTLFAQTVSGPVDLKVGPDGALYYLARNVGTVGKIVAGGTMPPQITQHPAAQTINLGGTATFAVAATGSQPLVYQWQENDVDIAGATAPSYTTPPATRSDNNDTYRCRVTNATGSVTSNAARLTVRNNDPPTPTIVTPTTTSRYSGGTTHSFSGAAMDPEDGAVAAGRLSWRIDFHHETHVHPAMPERVGVTSGTFTIPNTGETSADVWYRVHLTATDSAGLAATSFVDVRPNTATITISTIPAGLSALLDGQPVTTPTTVIGVVGIVRTIGAVTPQTLTGSQYAFSSWSDGGTASHTIVTRTSATTYIATYAAPLPAPKEFRIVR